MYQLKTLINKNTKLYYIKHGCGKKIMITIHGYGQSPEAFSTFKQSFSEYTLYHLELFFHTNSYLSRQDRPLTTDRWLEVFDSFLRKENISSFSIAGFSMGCKFLLPLVEKFAGRIEKMILVAPDGIASNRWYNLGVIYLKELFRYTVFHPKWFFRFLSFCYFLGCIDRSLMVFVKNQMNTLKKRWRVYQSWMNFKDLNVNFDKVSSTINQHNIRVLVSLGNHDTIIPAARIKRILKLIKKKEIINLDANHWELIEKTSYYILINHKKNSDRVNISGNAGFS